MSTIFAPIIPPVKAAVSMIRISGTQAGNVLCILTQAPLPKPRLATLARLISPIDHTPIDTALVLWFPAPHSFTGEDVVELHLHGSRAVLRHCLSVLSQMDGLRFAEAGEFSRRAFEHGKMDLTEAEGLADLIDAETTAQASQALRQMHGSLKKLYDRWRLELIELMAHVEAYIDFPEDDIPPDIAQDFENRITALKTTLTHHLNDKRRGELLRHGISVAIVGAPNTGKSTLLNQLSQRDVAIVSEHAGTTRDILEVHLDIGGFPFVIADTAGLRDSTDAIEQEGIRRALDRASQADIMLALFDATQPIPENNLLPKLHEHSFVIINKADHPDALLDATLYRLASITPHAPLMLSAKTGEGIDALLASLKTHAHEHMGIAASDDPFITRTRHRTLLLETLLHLESCNASQPIELYAESLRLAATTLGKITGHIDMEDVLDSLFRQFCIGK